MAESGHDPNLDHLKSQPISCRGVATVNPYTHPQNGCSRP